jgi:hypothetical protein
VLLYYTRLNNGTPQSLTEPICRFYDEHIEDFGPQVRDTLCRSKALFRTDYKRIARGRSSNTFGSPCA